MKEELQTQFCFAGFTLDLTRGRLFRGTEDVVLRPKSFALLGYMARNAGRVIPKDELLTILWPDVTVTEDSLTQCVHEVRQALGSGAAGLLRTVPRRGYLFMDDANYGPVSVAVGTSDSWASESGDAVTPPVPSSLRRDGIAVLPFVMTPSGAPRDAILFDGLAHDITSRLARLRSFHVIARGSTFALRHLAGDPQAAGTALGVAFAVAGIAGIHGNHVSLRVDLVEVESASVLWTEDFSEDRDRFIDLLDDLTDRIASAVQIQVTALEIRRVQAIPDTALTAWEAYHSGLPDAFTFDPERIGRALERFRLATSLCPGFARAHAAQSFCHYFRVFSGNARDRNLELLATRRAAERALEADDCNPSSHWAFGRALWLDGDPEGCLQFSERATQLSPSFVHAHYMIGFVETHIGDARRGIRQVDHVLSLSPLDPFLASAQITRAFALVRLGELDEAAVWARDAARQPNVYPTLLAPAALILACAGRTNEAQLVAAKLRAVAPGYRIADLRRSLNRLSEDVVTLFQAHAAAVGL